MESKISYERLLSLVELAEIQNQQNDFDEVLRLITHKVSTLLDSDSSLIMIVNPLTHNTIKTIIKEENPKIQKQHQFIHAIISGWVTNNKLPLLSTCLKEDNRFSRELFVNTPFKSCVCTLLKYEENIIGTLLVLRNNDKESLNEYDLDYLVKFGAVISPFLYNKQKIQEYFNPVLPESELLKRYEELGLVGKSSKFIEMLKSIESAAKCNVRVLLEGETGSVKEIVAKSIHRLSVRSNQKFIVVDCAAIPLNLMKVNCSDM